MSSQIKSKAGSESAILAVGSYRPSRLVPNADIVDRIESSDEWIQQRTGIETRRIASENESLIDMAVAAAESALKRAKLSIEDIDTVIVATITFPYQAPSAATALLQRMGNFKAAAFDINAACSGFLFSLTTAAQFIETGKYKKVIVVGGDKMSSIVDYTDRTTCVLFGDAAAAVLLEPDTEGFGIQDSILKSDGAGRTYLRQKAGGSVYPASMETVMNREHYVYQEGQTVFKFAVKGMADVSAEIMERNNLTGEDVAWLVPHQANKRIIDATRDRMGVSNDKVMMNIQRYGNTTNATIPLCLFEWEKQLKKGDNIILAAFGGGFTWGATYIKWAYDTK